MKSSLRAHHQLLILAIILLIHGSMLMTLILVNMNEGGPHEPIIMVEDQNRQEQPFPDRDWVAMNNSMPNTQMAAVDEPHEQIEHQDTMPHMDEHSQQQEQPRPESEAQKELERSQEEQAEETMDEQSFDDAIAMATQVLKEEKVAEVKPPEPKPAPPAAPSQLKTIAAAPTRPTLTMAQLAQGFTEQLQQADMAVRSDHGGVASIDQIKHINYCQKIIGCLVSSYKANNGRCPVKDLRHRARIQLALNKNGSIHHLSLQQSTGDPGADQFLLHMSRDAGSSFPPVPDALKQEPYHLPTFTIDSLESFRTPQGWYIDNRS